MKFHRLFFVVLAIASALAVGRAAAKDDPLDFLHMMQKEGFADVAIDYLEGLKTQPNPPPEIMRVWDLEMSKCKRAKSKSGAYSAAEAKQLADEAKASLEKFIKDNPDMPEAIQAAADWCAEQAIEAQYDVLRADYITDKAAKAEMLAKARKIFNDVRPRFEKSKDASAKLWAELPARASPKVKEDRFLQLGENRLKLSMVDFYLALTQADAAQRAADFDKVAKDFDKTYQDYRDYFLGWEAHYWNARIMQQQEKNKEAKDIYEEVLAHDETDVPDSSTAGAATPADRRAQRGREPRMEDYFFAEVEQHYLQTLYAAAKADYFREVKEWRKSHKNISEKTPGYQGLSLDYVRNLLTALKEAKDEATKEMAKREALRVLAEMSKVSGPYQRDAIELRRQANPNATPEDSFDDAIIDADAALEKKDWAGAAELYAKAIEAATPKTDQKKLAAVRNAYVGCIHNQASKLYQDNKVNEAIDLIMSVLKKREYLETAAAPAAASAALSWRYFQYLGAPTSTDDDKKAKEDLKAKTISLANAIIGVRDWTAREEADSARVTLLRIAMEMKENADNAKKAADAKAIEAKAKAAAAKVHGDADDAKTAATELENAATASKAATDEGAKQLTLADRIFKEINPNSHEYPTALTLLGYNHWSHYLDAKKIAEQDKENSKPITKEQQAAMDDDRKQAVTLLKQAVDTLNVPRAKGTVMPKELRAAMGLLAKMNAEGNDFKSAVVLYQTLLDDLLADPNTKTLDQSMLSIFNGAVQAYMQLGDMQNAAAVVAKLLDPNLGADDEKVNMAIINFAKRLEIKRKEALPDSGELTGEAKKKQDDLIDMELKIMGNLAKREKLEPSTMVWIAKTLSLLGRDEADDAATKLVDHIMDLANNNSDFDEKIGKAKAGLNSLAANLQAKHGNYKDANDHILALINQYPKALEPQMTQAKILTTWAAKDSTKYDDAIAAWKMLCNKLERAKTKSGDKMPEYYEAVYQRSFCYYKKADKDKDKDSARQGYDFLTPLLRLDPKIQGPKRDKELSLKYFQLAGKLADILGETRPELPKSSSKK